MREVDISNKAKTFGDCGNRCLIESFIEPRHAFRSFFCLDAGVLAKAVSQEVATLAEDVEACVKDAARQQRTQSSLKL